MAVDISPKMDATYSWRQQPMTHLRLSAHKPIAAWRRARRLLPPRATTGGPMAVTSAFDAVADHYRAEDWAFVDGFFDPAGFRTLTEGWPSREYFVPMLSMHKSYDFSFRYDREKGDSPHLQAWPALRDAYDTLRAPEMCERVTALIGDGRPRECAFLVSTWATAGSSLIPHRDTIADVSEDGDHLVLLFFVDATGGPLSGGTSIIGDADYERPIFEPTQLTNSAIIYNQTARFWHGFRPMRRGAWRWTINAQYSPA
jgi:hypothetical protein